MPRKPVLSKQCRCSRLPTPHPTCNADNHKIPKSADPDFRLDIRKTFVFINKKRSTPEQIVHPPPPPPHLNRKKRAPPLGAYFSPLARHVVQVEVNSGESGDPRLVLVGLPDAAVKESEDRVHSALSNSGFAMPETRTTINLAPADIRKEGPLYDLPIALGILLSTGQLTPVLNPADYLVAGELGLSGITRPIRGALAIAQLARKLGKTGLLLPPRSAEEAALVEGIAVYRVESLDQAHRFLSGTLGRRRQPQPAHDWPAWLGEVDDRQAHPDHHARAHTG